MDDKFIRFENWLRENGAEFKSLELRTYDDPSSASKTCIEGAGCNIGRDYAEEKKETNHVSPKTVVESEMRGVHAKTAILPETICLSIPRKCLITVEMGQATPIGQAILAADLDLDAPKHIFLMIYMLWDRKLNRESSFFDPYYQILPKHLNNMPVFWSREELEFLQGSDLLDQIADRIEAITEDYLAICGLVPDFANLASLEEFKWARMCVCSRNFGLLIDGHRTSAMVPFADMLNHYRPRETKWTFDDDRDAFTITTIYGIPLGAQVYDSYGSKSNHRFLLNYGFAVEDNRELDGFCPNEVSVNLSVSPSDTLYYTKMDFWTRTPGYPLSETSFEKAMNICSSQLNHRGIKSSLSSSTSANTTVLKLDETVSPSNPRLGLGNHSRLRSPSVDSFASPIKSIRISVLPNHENNKILFSLCRVLACNEVELLSLSESSSFSSSPGWNLLGFASSSSSSSSGNITFSRTCRDIRHPINLRNEKETLIILSNLVQCSLSKYPTSLSQDTNDLLDEKAYPLYSNRRHAKIQVKGEKEILHHFQCWCHVGLKVISVIEQELDFGKGNKSTQVEPNFDQALQSLDFDDKMSDSQKSIIFRYCYDILGALRKEELKKVRVS